MRRLILALDALPGLREVAAAADLDVAAAATLAELAGVEGVRLSVNEDLKPVRPEDVLEARRAARLLELRMAPSQSLLKVALEARPDRVILVARGTQGGREAGLAPLVRALNEAGIPVSVRIPPEIEALKAVHSQEIAGVEFHVTRVVDLPAAEREAELEGLGDAAKLAAKLRLPISLGGGLGYANLREVLAAAPVVETVVVGRAAIARAVLVGLDRAVRDLRALVE